MGPVYARVIFSYFSILLKLLRIFWFTLVRRLPIYAKSEPKTSDISNICLLFTFFKTGQNTHFQKVKKHEKVVKKRCHFLFERVFHFLVGSATKTKNM